MSKKISRKSVFNRKNNAGMRRELSELEKYVKDNFSNQNKLLNKMVLRAYFNLWKAEDKQQGLCKSTTVKYSELASIFGVGINSVGKILRIMHGVLVEVRLGDFVPKNEWLEHPEKAKRLRNATRIRRFSLFELKNYPEFQLYPDFKTNNAEILADRLSNRDAPSFSQVKWKAINNGRVYMTGCNNLQSLSSEKRIEKLKAGLRHGEVLHRIDVSQAEPSMLWAMTNLKPADDPDNFYNSFRDSLNKSLQLVPGIDKLDRKDTKTIVLKAHNQENSLDLFNTSNNQYVNGKNYHANDHTRQNYSNYFKKLQTWKKLWQFAGRGNRNRRPYTLTAAGRVVEFENRPEAGQFIAAKTQGSIADVINKLSLEILKRERETGIRLAMIVHDEILFYASRVKGDYEVGRLKAVSNKIFNFNPKIKHEIFS